MFTKIEGEAKKYIKVQAKAVHKIESTLEECKHLSSLLKAPVRLTHGFNRYIIDKMGQVAQIR